MILSDKIFEDAHISLGIYMAIEDYFKITLKDAEIVNIELPEELISLVKGKMDARQT
jgi:acyl carrier protein